MKTRVSGACTLTHQVTVNLVEDREVLHYYDYDLCSADPILTPMGLGPDQSQGAFAAYPSNLSLNTVTGVIDPSAITNGGSFQVCWEMTSRMCRDSICTPVLLTANPTPDPEFGLVPFGGNQNETVFCLDELPATTSANTSGGTLTQLLPAGPSYVSGNTFGSAGTPPGLYTLEYAFTTPCPSAFELDIQVLDYDSIDFEYHNYISGDNRFCQGEEYVIPTINSGMQLGGVYSILSPPNGLSIEDSTGTIFFQLPPPGIYNVVYTSPGPCPQSDTVQFEVITSPQSNFNLSAFSICEGTPFLTLTAANTAPTWEIVEDMSPNNVLSYSQGSAPNSIHIQTQNASPGRYRVRHTMGQGGCQSTTEQYFTILDVDNTTDLSIVDSTLNQTYCAGDTLEFLISGATIGNFNIQGLSSNRDSALVTVALPDYLPNASYTATYSAYGQCDEENTLTFTVLAKDSTQLDFPQTAYCENEAGIGPAMFSPSNGIFYIYSANANFLIDPINGKITVNDSLNNEVQATVTYSTNAVCPNEAQEIIAFYPTPKSIALATDPTGEACYGETVTLIASASGAQDFQFAHIGGAIHPFTPISIASFPNLPTGTPIFELTAKSSRGCIASIQVPYEIKPIPYYLNDTTDYITLVHPQQGMVDIRTSPAISTTHWEAVTTNYNLQNEDNDVAPPAFVFNGNLLSTFSRGEATIYLQPESDECLGEIDSIKVIIQPIDVDIFIPGIFTPNGDGKNDNWEITSKPGFDAAGYKMKVFTTAGSLVDAFNLSQGLTQWQGNNAPDGVYRWMLFDRSGNFVQKGGLTIIRTPYREQ